MESISEDLDLGEPWQRLHVFRAEPTEFVHVEVVGGHTFSEPMPEVKKERTPDGGTYFLCIDDREPTGVMMGLTIYSINKNESNDHPFSVQVDIEPIFARRLAQKLTEAADWAESAAAELADGTAHSPKGTDAGAN